MTELQTKYGKVKIYAKNLEDTALVQITQLANSKLGKGANIRIMPDAHAGAGCVIGTTMLVVDKVCPNLVGVDIGCGVDLIKTNIDFKNKLQQLDNTIRKFVPFGKSHHNNPQTYRDFAKLKCWDKLKAATKETAIRSLGTLGGGNHFIEAYSDGYLAVHSGSRNIGFKVAEYYQTLAEQTITEEENSEKSPKSLAFLVGENMKDYLHDMNIMQAFAVANRKAMLDNIVARMGGEILSQITSTHNYIDIQQNAITLRKGAISAQKGQELVIPLNMRDGLLVCVGLGNPDWNYSAPHGAGRLYSRSKAKSILKLEDYKATMKGIFSSCINRDTLDEAPFAYKDYKEIIELIKPTVDIKERLVPIFNFKASE